MRLGTLLAYLSLTVFACGGTDNMPDEGTPEATETEATESVGRSNDTSDDASALFDMSKPPVLMTTVIAPPESKIENEGEVLVDVRTVNSAVDTAWVAESSGFPQVDEFALNHILTNNMNIKVGWGDPPFQIKVFVRQQSSGDSK